MNRIDAYIRLGRFMISTAPKFVDHTYFNNWSRVGDMLTDIGLPFVTDPNNYSREDRDVVIFAANVMAGKFPMPELHPDKEAHCQTRVPRMSKILNKMDKPVFLPTGRPRGRPRKVVV